jgi:hypothetical protein
MQSRQQCEDPGEFADKHLDATARDRGAAWEDPLRGSD